MADNFAKENQTEETVSETSEETQETDKIKLGENEFTQDELTELVGLGRIAKEAEEKYNVKVDGIWPKFQQTINEKIELEKKFEEDKKAKETQELQSKASNQEDLSEEEQLKLASLKLKELGFVSKDDVVKEVDAILAGKQLLSEVETLVSKQAEDGNPKTTSEELLTYMQENGIKNPQVAYKLKFESELDEIKSKKLDSVKKDKFVTDETSGGGIKNPQTKPLTRYNLNEALSEVLSRNN